MSVFIYLLIALFGCSIAIAYMISKVLSRAILHGSLVSFIIIFVFTLFMFVQLYQFQDNLKDDLLYVMIVDDKVLVEGGVDGLFVKGKKNLTLYLDRDIKQNASFFLTIDIDLFEQHLGETYDFEPYLERKAPDWLIKGQTDTMLGLLRTDDLNTYLRRIYNVSARSPEEMQLQFALMAFTMFYESASFSEVMHEMNAERFSISKKPVSLRLLLFFERWIE